MQLMGLEIWVHDNSSKTIFVDTTIGRILLLVGATFRGVRHLVEKNSQVRHSVQIVKSLFFDQMLYSKERCIY